MTAPTGRGDAWTEERGTSDDGRRRVQSGPAAQGKQCTRVEHDSMGEVEVPADALWGAQTQRAVDNFPISGEPIGRDLIGPLGHQSGPLRLPWGRCLCFCYGNAAKEAQKKCAADET